MLAFVSGRRAFVENRYRDAEEALRASIPLLEAVGGDVHCSFAYRYIGRLAAVRGDYDASVQAIDAALRLARELGLSAFANVLLTDLAASLAAPRDFELARSALDEPLASARRPALFGRRPRGHDGIGVGRVAGRQRSGGGAPRLGGAPDGWCRPTSARQRCTVR